MKDKAEKMKEVWYFSGTGQGEYLAKELCKRNINLRKCNITSYTRRSNMERNVKDKDIIIIYPIYASTVPQPLQQFFRELTATNTDVVLIALWGNAHNSQGVQCASDILRLRGFHIVGAAELVAQHSCLINRSNNTFTNDRIDKILNYIELSFKMKDDISIKTNHETLLTRLLCTVPNSGVIKKVTDLEFSDEQCIHCNACVNVCPSLARISPEEINEKKCIRCFACETICPRNAINIHVKWVAQKALMHHQKKIHKDIFL